MKKHSFVQKDGLQEKYFGNLLQALELLLFFY